MVSSRVVELELGGGARAGWWSSSRGTGLGGGTLGEALRAREG